jgi:hypothetical protein
MSTFYELRFAPKRWTLDEADTPYNNDIVVSPSSLNLKDQGITSVIWATGFVVNTITLNFPSSIQRANRSIGKVSPPSKGFTS